MVHVEEELAFYNWRTMGYKLKDKRARKRKGSKPNSPKKVTVHTHLTFSEIERYHKMQIGKVPQGTPRSHLPSSWVEKSSPPQGSS